MGAAAVEFIDPREPIAVCLTLSLSCSFFFQPFSMIMFFLVIDLGKTVLNEVVTLFLKDFTLR